MFFIVYRSKITCKSDKDCPEYSRCEKATDGTNSICKFGSFLCPKKLKDRFMTGITNENCIFVNTDVWNLDKEEMIKDINSNSLDDKLILKTCPKYYNKSQIKCSTEKCMKDDNCFSGMCQSQKCIVNDKVDHSIYRCTGSNNKVKCGKHLGMMCGSDEDCYSSHCTYGHCSTKGTTSTFLRNLGSELLIAIGIFVLIFCIIYIILRIYHSFK